MKIKNFKINQKAASKLATCVLVGTLVATTLTGCEPKNNERNNILKGTILENTCVVTFEDGSKDIAITVGTCNDVNYHHYYSVISGEYFGSEKCNRGYLNRNVLHHYSIKSEETITNYLTADILTKALQNELDNDDISAIITKILEPTVEETNEKSR